MRDNPLIVQSDRTLILEVYHRLADKCRSEIGSFCELVKSPEFIHTYEITPISIWNAQSQGITTEQMKDTLEKYSKVDIPNPIIHFIDNFGSRFGSIMFIPKDEENFEVSIPNLRYKLEITNNEKLIKYLNIDGETITAKLLDRGTLKLIATQQGYAVDDQIPLIDGAFLDIEIKERDDFKLRDYQKEAATALVNEKKQGYGFGTIVLPCGSGKTVVGMTCMSQLKCSTLIVTTNIVAVHQWINELIDKTNINPDLIGEYTSERKVIRPITVCTYQVLTYRQLRSGDTYKHLDIFRNSNFGLVIYDEVHVLPAPIFKLTAEIQALHRVGLTATLVREDGKERDVFSLIGPKRYEVMWNVMEAKGFIAEAKCKELRIPLHKDIELQYAIANRKEKFRLASENVLKEKVIEKLLEEHKDKCILIIGQYIEQLNHISEKFNLPLITGKTNNKTREVLYENFKNKKDKVLVVSKVANFAIDLPDASVAIQVSGTYGSRQEEAQRLGRIIRPKDHTSYFYTVVSNYTIELDFSLNRQKFLSEQGYSYEIEEVNEL